MFMPTDFTGSVNLQATLSAATASNDGVAVLPHHPLTCAAGGLYFDEDGVLSCDHAKTEVGDRRTQAGLNHTIAILLLEYASRL